MSVGAMFAGAPHAADRQYVFKTLGASPWPTDGMDLQRAAEISAYWVRFARSGDPNDAALPQWPRLAASDTRLLDFTNEGPVARPPPGNEALAAIARSYAGE